MELKQLEYFIVLCEELHFTKAAEKLGIAQPSLSQQIQLLEHEIGTRLIDRVGKKNVITDAGKILLHHSYNIFHEISQARAAINDLQGIARGSLKIGALFTVVDYLLPQTVIKFHDKYPNVNLSIHGLLSRDIYKKLLQNELDLGIVSLPMELDQLEMMPLYKEELVLVAHKDDLVTQESYVTLEILQKTSTILLPNSYHIRKIINEGCRSYEFKPQPIMEMTTMESIINMVLNRVGVTILPKAYVDYLNNKDLCTIPFKNPELTRQVGIIYRKNKFLCAASRMFVETLVKMIKDEAFRPNISRLITEIK